MSKPKLKVLFVTPYITNPISAEFMRNQTGFGYMVFDIARSVGKTEHVDLITSQCFTEGMSLDGVRILRNTKNMVRGLNFRCVIDGLKFLCNHRLPFMSAMRAFYMYLFAAKLNRIVRNYDVVHIHGVSPLTDATINVCMRNRIPFVVTLHGLNSFDDTVSLHPALKQYEKEFLSDACVKGWPVSFISSGNIKNVESYLGMTCRNFHVISNGCDVTEKETGVAEQARLLSDDDFVFVCVGNVSKNKNQIQIARSWSLMPYEDRKRTKVLFVGRYEPDGELACYIRDNDLRDSLILCGLQPKELLPSYYRLADATILTSFAEGFGLSIIEGFVYGKPCVTFSDLPAFNDIFDKSAIIAPTDRSDVALASAMSEVIHGSFDADAIKAYSTKFSYESMAERYYKLYCSIVGYEENIE